MFCTLDDLLKRSRNIVNIVFCLILNFFEGPTPAPTAADTSTATTAATAVGPPAPASQPPATFAPGEPAAEFP